MKLAFMVVVPREPVRGYSSQWVFYRALCIGTFFHRSFQNMDPDTEASQSATTPSAEVETDVEEMMTNDDKVDNGSLI